MRAETGDVKLIFFTFTTHRTIFRALVRGVLRMKSLWIALCVFFTLSNAIAQTAANTAEIVYLNSEENRFYQLINQFRAQLDLPQLQLHVYLQNATKKHSEWMASQDFLTHYGPTQTKTPFQRMEEEGYVNYTSAGENVACGNSTAVATFIQWATSPKHLQNMISPHFRHMGISRAGTGRESCPYYWANDFGSFSDIRLDAPTITDVAKIQLAAESVVGSLNGKVIRLPDDVIPSTSSPSPAATPTARTLPTTDISMIQCTIPANLSKGILHFTPGVDTVLEATKSANSSGYTIKLSYIRNGEIGALVPLYIYGVSVVKSADFPMYAIFSAPGIRGGFSIQFNTQTNQAQFDPYNLNSGGASGSILCSLKMN
jgi:uncharacterized protein YkwD